MSKLKVYGVNYDGRTRRIVAATSQKKAAELTGVSFYSFSNYGCETGNKEEIEIAMKNPGTVWSQGYYFGAEWTKVLK